MTGNTLMAGWATVDITPALPCWLGGYAARTAPAADEHDPLYAQALALGSRAAPFIIVVCDVLAVSRSLVESVRRAVSAQVPGATTWLAATHTHSGPASVLPRFGPGVENADPASDTSAADVAALAAGVVKAAQDAVARMHSVHPAWVSEQITNVVTNRDHPGSGEDTEIALLCLYEALPGDLADATPAAILASFPCHPTVLGAENLELSADLPGAWRRQLQARMGTEAWLALATGAAGDMSTRHTRQGQGFDELERLGTVLAEQTYTLLSRVHPLYLNSPHIHSVIYEPALKDPTQSMISQAQVQAVEAERQRALQHGQTAEARTLETTLQGLRAAEARVRAHGEHSLEISVALLGDLVVVSIPGELYNRLGVEIRRRVGKTLLFLGYTNGYTGYLPTSDAYASLDYEVLMSPFAPGVGERVCDTAIQLLKQSS